MSHLPPAIPRQYLLELSVALDGSAYWFFAPILRHQIQALRACLQDRFTVQYAVKANSHPAILAFMANESLGADVSSAGELQAALAAGIGAEAISFSGPGKTRRELELAASLGLGSINVENIAELETLTAIRTTQTGQPIRISLRLNPGPKNLKSGLKMAGDTQFGLAAEDLPHALALLRQANGLLDFQGIHVHAGSQILDAQAIVDNLQSILAWALQIEADSGLPLRKINCGGGWGIPYFANQNPLDLHAVATGLTELFAAPPYADLPQRCQLIVEPGRFLVAQSGVYASKILYRKIMRGKQFAIVEGGMHHNYLLAGGMGQVIRRNFAMEILPNPTTPPPAPMEPPLTLDIAGSLCTPQDVLAIGYAWPWEVRTGDTAVFYNCGAYGLSASPTQFLSHPLPEQKLLTF